MNDSAFNLLHFRRKYLLKHIYNRDLRRLNRAAHELNAEAADVLGYQILSFPPGRP